MEKEKLILNVIKKRIRKKVASSDFYKKETPEHLSKALESAKETTILGFIIFIIFRLLELQSSIKTFFICFFISWIFWKICQVAINSWTRLNRLHKIILEEKNEIEKNRENERKELETIYSAKGFSGNLLKEVVDTLMADDNRLLQVMMEEEMGLTLRTYEHPLKLGLYAGLSAFLTTGLLFLGLFGEFYFEFFIIGGLILILTSLISTKKDKSNLSFLIVWNIAIAGLISLITYFITKIVI